MSLEVQNHTHTHRLQSSLIHQNKVTMRPYHHDTICKITHRHRLQGSLIHQNKVTMRPYLHDEICKITHTHRSCSQVVDLAAHGHWTSSIFVDGLENWFLPCNETTKQWSLDIGWVSSDFATLMLGCKSPSVTEKLRQAFRQLVHPDAMRFWATFPGHSCEQGVFHKNSSGSCFRGMSNPITHITRILLAIKRSRRMKKGEKQKFVPYKIYFLCHS
jgi:hypothetical protein